MPCQPWEFCLECEVAKLRAQLEDIHQVLLDLAHRPAALTTTNIFRASAPAPSNTASAIPAHHNDAIYGVPLRGDVYYGAPVAVPITPAPAPVQERVVDVVHNQD